MTTITRAGTAKVVVEIYGKERPKRKALRRPRTTDVEGADCGRDVLGQTVPTSKYGQQQQGRPDRRRWTAVYDGQLAIGLVRNSHKVEHETKKYECTIDQELTDADA